MRGEVSTEDVIVVELPATMADPAGKFVDVKARLPPVATRGLGFNWLGDCVDKARELD